MTVIHDLAMARVERETDNSKVSVEQILELALHHVRTDQTDGKPVAAFICLILEDEGRSQTMKGYRCGLRRDQEIGYIELFKQMQIEKWSRG